MSVAASTKQWIQLHCDDTQSDVVVTPDDGDRFAIPMQLAIRGCKIASQLDKYNQQFNELLGFLSGWCHSHSQDVRDAYVALKDEGLLFLIVQRSVNYDQALEDSLTDLDLAVAQNPDYDLIRLSVLSLPDSNPATIKSFLPPGGSLVHNNAERTRARRTRKS